MTQILPENLKKIELKDIFLNKDKFGVLTFDKSYPIIEMAKKFIVELQDLGYRERLTQQEAQTIDQDAKRITDLIREVSLKDPSVDANFNLTVRDQLESKIIRLCEDVQTKQREKLVYLRQEVSLSKPDNKQIQDEQKELFKIRTQYESTLSDLQKKIELLTNEKQVIENTQGEIAATRFGKHFENQADEYETTAKGWLVKRNTILVVLEIVISINFLAYLAIFIGWKAAWWPNFPPSAFFTIDYAVIKISGVLLLSYILGFNSKNYSINKNLSVKNKHRKNVADTINNFLDSTSDQETKSQIIKQGAEAMFKDEDTGYLGKINEKGHSPIEQVTYIMPNKKE